MQPHSERFHSCASIHPVPQEAVGEILGACMESTGVFPDFVLLTALEPLAVDLPSLSVTTSGVLAPELLVALSITGSPSHQVDTWSTFIPESKISIFSAQELNPIALRFDVVGDQRITEAAWEDQFKLISGLDMEQYVLLLLGDSESFDSSAFLRLWRATFPATPVVGGLCPSSGGSTASMEPRFVLNGDSYHDGAIGILINSKEAIGAQLDTKYRPLGEPLTVTRSSPSQIMELASENAVSRLMEAIASDPVEWDALSFSKEHIKIGRVTNEYLDDYRQADFTLGNVLDFDEPKGSLLVQDRYQVGNTIQFHISDPELSLRSVEATLRATHLWTSFEAGVIFSYAPELTRHIEGLGLPPLSTNNRLSVIPLIPFHEDSALGHAYNENDLQSCIGSILLFGNEGDNDEIRRSS